ncbi:UNVERIFIED_CONTAM: hypothetical protein PYX00_009893 [Menopon gallinae]|uniref:Inner centromere protein ARK-binding domain-containing protein n=1 Tax=Menopon gallinae TaxID=328185 RepID=A0AAW2HDB1_9NEOP
MVFSIFTDCLKVQKVTTMNKSGIFDKIRNHLMPFNEEYKKSIQCLSSLIEDSLQCLDELELNIRDELAKEKKSYRKQTLPRQMNTTNSVMGCSILTRTRAAQRVNESQLQMTNIIVGVCDTTRSICSGGQTGDKNEESVSQKRPAEAVELNDSCKKIKYKNCSIVETPKSDRGAFIMSRIKAEDANATKNLPIPSKRTKPVVKSKFFDDDGNILKPECTLKEGLTEDHESCSPTSSQTQNLSAVNSDKSIEFISPEVNNANCTEVLSETGCSLRVKQDSITCTRICDTTSNVMNLAVKSSTAVENSMVSSYSLRSSVNIQSSKIGDLGGDETMSSGLIHEAKCSTPKTVLVEKPYALRSSANVQKMGTTITDLDQSIKEEAHSIENRSTRLRNRRESNQENEERPKRTRKARTKKKVSDEIDAEANKGPITRTKSRKNQETIRKSRVSVLARKSLMKAKVISLQHCKLENLKSELKEEKVQSNIVSSLQCSASKMTKLSSLRSDLLGKICSSQMKLNRLKSSENIMNTGRGKYQLLKSDSKRKENPLLTRVNGDLAAETLLRSAMKGKGDEIEKELKLRALKEKEEEALLKKTMSIKKRQKELKEKNEKKLNSVMKQRKKLESEKLNNIVQLEREKEEKRRIRLQERELKMKENALQKKLLLEKKLAETEERRRLEEEARLAKLKEQEAEQERIMIERQKELELQEKRAQERLADQKAREKYEMKLKEEQSKQKMVASKLQSKKVCDYRSRNENDYGLEDENSELDSDHEERTTRNRPLPQWAKRVLSRRCPFVTGVTKKMITEFLPCLQKTPDIVQMFNMTPKKRIARTSSAIWNTPSS